MKAAGRRPVLDGVAGRLIAVAVFLACAGALAYLHRDELFPARPQATADRDDPFARCYAEDVAKIEKMLADEVIGDDRARLFRLRTEARCRAQADKAAGTGGAQPGAK